MEASFRKPPPSARAARVMKAIPTTPVRIPSQMDSWSTNRDLHVRQRPDHTPHQLGQSPQISRFDQKSPVMLKKPAFLPGFQNSFATAPLRLNTNDARGKSKDVRREDSFEHIDPIASQNVEPWVATQVLHRYSSSDHEDSLQVEANPDRATPSVDEDGDVVMVDDVGEGTPNEIEPIEPLNHKAEVSSLTFCRASVLSTPCSYFASS